MLVGGVFVCGKPIQMHMMLFHEKKVPGLGCTVCVCSVEDDHAQDAREHKKKKSAVSPIHVGC